MARFDIYPDIKHRLLHGLDDIAMTNQMGEAIDLFEDEREAKHWVGTTNLEIPA